MPEPTVHGEQKGREKEMTLSETSRSGKSDAAAAASAADRNLYSAAQQASPAAAPTTIREVIAPTTVREAIKTMPEDRVTSYIDQTGRRKKGTSTWDKLKQGYQQAYQAQQDQNARALETAQQRAQEATAAQIEALNQGYQGTNRQLYRDYMERQRTLPQQMAAQGYTGGLTESSRLRLGNAYEEALNSNENSRLGQEASYNEALNQRLYEAQAAADAANSQALQNYYSQISQLNAQKQEQERSDLEKRAATMAAAGDFSLYKKLGYTDAQIRRLKRQWQKANGKTGKTRGSRGGSGGGKGKAKTKAGYSDQEIAGALSGGATPAEIAAAAERAAAAGELTPAQARQAEARADLLYSRQTSHRQGAAGPTGSAAQSKTLTPDWDNWNRMGF